MAALGYFRGEEISSATLADSVNADRSFVRKSLSKLSKAGLVVTKRGKSGASVLARPPRQITLLDIYQCQYGTTSVCDSLVSGQQEVCGQLQPQGVHVGGSFSSSVQLREIARQNNPGQSGRSDQRKGASGRTKGMMTINGGSAMSAPVVRSGNVLKRKSMRFVAALMAVPRQLCRRSERSSGCRTPAP